MYLEDVLPEFRKGAKIKSVLWRRGQYLRYDAKTKDIIDEEGVTYDITGNLLSSNLWEFYKEPEPDWDYIVKSKCLCWFWDDVDSLEESSYGYLTYHNKNILYCYNGKKWYKNCRPVRKDEVTFYEDKK